MLHGADGRSPQGECGLKYYGEAAHLSDHASLPARGVWIEIGSVDDEDSVYSSLPARGVWIEILPSGSSTLTSLGRSPQGECGLKCPPRRTSWTSRRSLPARGVWIEISSFSKESGVKESLPARGVWIEIPVPAIPACPARSLPARGVCIEIANPLGTGRRRRVTPRKGSVD